MDIDSHAAVVILAQMLRNIEQRLARVEDIELKQDADKGREEFRSLIQELYRVMEGDDS